MGKEMKCDSYSYICNHFRLRHVYRLLAVMADTSVRRATQYFAPNLTAKLTRQRRFGRRDRQSTFLLTIGRPNYAERKFIAACQKAGESFPVKKIQVKQWAKPK